MENPDRLRRGGSVLLPLLLFLGAFVLYLPSLEYDFTVDDPLLTLQNPLVREFRGDYVPFFRNNLYAGTALERGNAYVYRPLLMASLALNYQLAGYEFDPFGFHLMNVGLFGLLVAIVFLLAESLQGTSRAWGPASVIALLFLAFPSHSEVVCNVKNREEILALLFGASAWWLLVRKSTPGARDLVLTRLAAPFLFLLALLSKESALLLLPCMILWDRVISKVREDEEGGRSRFSIISFCLAVGCYLILRRYAVGAWFQIPGIYGFFSPEDGLWTRLLTSAPLFVKYYLWDQLVALKLNPAFSTRFLVPVERSITLAAAASVLGLLALLLASVRGVMKHGSVTAFWLVFFFITSFFAFQFVPLGTVGAFRLMLTPSLGLCALLGMGLWRIATPAADGRRTIPLRRAIGTGIILMVVISYALATRARSGNWRNDGALYAYSARIAPGNPLSHYAAAESFARSEQADKKYRHLESALDIFMARGDEAFLFDERALDAYSVAATEIAYRLIESDPSRALALSDLAIIQFGKLRALREEGLDVNVASPYYVKARVLANLGRNRESADTCREGLALAYHPGLDRLLHALIKQEKGLSPGSR